MFQAVTILFFLSQPCNSLAFVHQEKNSQPMSIRVSGHENGQNIYLSCISQSMIKTRQN